MYKVNRTVQITSEEKVAKKMAMLLADLTLDLEKVGYYLAHANSYLWYARATEVLEAAVYNREVEQLNKWGEYKS
jgi:3-oxoacyl-(acyl-carrier-protein) synthase